MRQLQQVLYRTNKSIPAALAELGVVLEETDINTSLGDLQTCTHCNVWFHDHQLIPDLDDNQICSFCAGYYGL